MHLYNTLYRMSESGNQVISIFEQYGYMAQYIGLVLGMDYFAPSDLYLYFCLYISAYPDFVFAPFSVFVFLKCKAVQQAISTLSRGLSRLHYTSAHSIKHLHHLHPLQHLSVIFRSARTSYRASVRPVPRQFFLSS